MIRRLMAHRAIAGFAAGVAATVVLFSAAAGALFLGGFDTSASVPHIRAVGWAAHATMQHSVALRARRIHPPAAFSASDVAAGARLYNQNCIACHGGPGVPRAAWVSAMIPTPPYLVDAPRRWSRAELFEIVDHGVKMTAMPAWGLRYSQRDVWSLVAYLESLPRIPPRTFQEAMLGSHRPAPCRTGEGNLKRSPAGQREGFGYPVRPVNRSATWRHLATAAPTPLRGQPEYQGFSGGRDGGRDRD